MAHYVLLLLMSLILSGCCCFAPPKSMYEDRKMVQRDTEGLSAVVYDYLSELQHEKFLRCERAYVCTNSLIRLEFITQDILTMEMARQLLVELVDGLLTRLNNEPAGFLGLVYPLSFEQLEVYIKCETYFGQYVDPYYISWIVLEDSMAYYYAFTLDDTRKDCWDFRVEPYFKSRSFAYLFQQAEEKYFKAHPKSDPADFKASWMNGRTSKEGGATVTK